MEVIYYDRSVMEFIDEQQKMTRAKISRELMVLKEFGFMLGLPQSRKLHGHLYELRIRGQQEIRLFYTFFEEKAVILYGFVKKTNKIPKKELLVAEGRLRRLTNI